MNLLSYNQAKEYVCNNKDTLRAVVSTHPKCTKYHLVCEVLTQKNIPFVIMNSEDSENFFKSAVSPTTFFFNEQNTCYPFYSEFDGEMLDRYLTIIRS